MRGCELETGSAAPGQGLGDGRGAGGGPILPGTLGPLGRCGGSLLGHLSYAGVTLPSSLQCIVPMQGVGGEAHKAFAHSVERGREAAVGTC